MLRTNMEATFYKAQWKSPAKQFLLKIFCQMPALWPRKLQRSTPPRPPSKQQLPQAHGLAG